MTASTGTRSVHTASIWALARVEGRQLVRHPAVLAGVAFGLLVLIVNRVESDLPDGYDLLRMVPVFLAVGTFIGANLNALRTRRHGTGELYEAARLPARQRTAGHILSVLWAVALAAVLGAIVLVTLALSNGLQVSFVDDVRTRVPNLVEFALGPLVVGLFGVVGVLLARWVPSVVVPLMAIVGALPYVMAEAWMVAGPGGWYAPLWSNARIVYWVWLGNGGYPIVRDFAVAALAWHLLFLAGLIVVASVLALARKGWTRRLTIGAVAGIGAAVLGATMQVAASTPWL